MRDDGDFVIHDLYFCYRSEFLGFVFLDPDLVFFLCLDRDMYGVDLRE